MNPNEKEKSGNTGIKDSVIRNSQASTIRNIQNDEQSRRTVTTLNQNNTTNHTNNTSLNKFASPFSKNPNQSQRQTQNSNSKVKIQATTSNHPQKPNSAISNMKIPESKSKSTLNSGLEVIIQKEDSKLRTENSINDITKIKNNRSAISSVSIISDNKIFNMSISNFNNDSKISNNIQNSTRNMNQSPFNMFPNTRESFNSEYNFNKMNNFDVRSQNSAIQGYTSGAFPHDSQHEIFSKSINTNLNNQEDEAVLRQDLKQKESELISLTKAYKELKIKFSNKKKIVGEKKHHCEKLNSCNDYTLQLILARLETFNKKV